MKDGAVDGGDVGGGDDEEVSGEVALRDTRADAIGSRRRRRGRVMRSVAWGAMTVTLSVGGLEGLDFGFGQMAGADDDAQGGR